MTHRRKLLPAVDVIAEAEHLLFMGEHPEWIAAQIGRSVGAIEHMARRYESEAVWRPFQRVMFADRARQKKAAA